MALVIPDHFIKHMIIRIHVVGDIRFSLADTFEVQIIGAQHRGVSVIRTGHDVNGDIGGQNIFGRTMLTKAALSLIGMSVPVLFGGLAIGIYIPEYCIQ